MKSNVDFIEKCDILKPIIIKIIQKTHFKVSFYSHLLFIKWIPQRQHFKVDEIPMAKLFEFILTRVNNKPNFTILN